MFERKLELGNFTLVFGEKFVLLDLFDEIVLPAFSEGEFTRKIGKHTEYVFIDVKLVHLEDEGEPVVGLAGRLVKNTKVSRHQTYSQTGGIEADVAELDSAPSTSFLLILNNHRIIVSKEVPGAPDLEGFSNSCRYFIQKSYKRYITEIYRSRRDVEDKKIEGLKSKLSLIQHEIIACNENGDLDSIENLNADSNGVKAEIKNIDKTSWKDIFDEFPEPELRITPISDDDSLDDFVGRMKSVELFSVKLLPTNSEEINGDSFYKSFDKSKTAINSRTAKLEYRNPKAGLDKGAVTQQAIQAGEYGNTAIKIYGTNQDGSEARGTNDNFKLIVPFASVAKSILTLAGKKYESYKQLIGSGQLKVPVNSEGIVNKIIEIAKRHIDE
jgi:hypothetical protein